MDINQNANPSKIKDPCNFFVSSLKRSQVHLFSCHMFLLEILMEVPHLTIPSPPCIDGAVERPTFRR